MKQPDEQFAQAGEIELCYEEFGPADGEPLLLVMGLATQMIGWHEDFCSELVERGYRVIRFDNRDIGHSTKLEDAPMPSRGKMVLGLGKPAYTLSDMAGDAAGLLDALEIESAHVAGASMGGMIGQMLAIEHPERVRSLASIMSGPGTRASRLPRMRAFGAMMSAPPKDREDSIERAGKIFRVIGSPGFERDDEWFRDVVGMSWDRSNYPPGIIRQMHAISASPSRAKPLTSVRVPTVVVHGDKDPLVRLSAGKATAKAVPGARLLVIEGMGHDLPREAWPRIIGAIDENASRAGEAHRSAAPPAPARG